MTLLSPVRVAGRSVSDPLAVLRSYVDRPVLARALRLYDAPGPGEPDVVLLDEARRTRRIASRMSEVQAEWFVERSKDDVVRTNLRLLPAGARLADADPLDSGGLYDKATALFEAFATAAPAGVAGGKLHKLLHIKRPALIPILDSKLRRVYKDEARRWGMTIRRERGLKGHGYWAAIRADLVDLENAAAIAACRSELVSREDSECLLALSDLRLLDILSWQL